MNEAIAECLLEGRQITFTNTVDAAASRFSYSVRVLANAFGNALKWKGGK